MARVFLQNHLIAKSGSADGMHLAAAPSPRPPPPPSPLPHSSISACSSSKTSQHHSLRRALCAEAARKLLESHQAAAKLRVLFVQMLLATPAHREVVMTAWPVFCQLLVFGFLLVQHFSCINGHVLGDSEVQSPF